MQIISFLFKKFVVLESPEIRYYLKNPISKKVLVTDDDTGIVRQETVVQEYVPIYTNTALVRRRFDPDYINFKLLIPLCDGCEDSFVDPQLMKGFIDIDNKLMEMSSIQSFISNLEDIMLPYSDARTNYKYLQDFLIDYYRYFCSINPENSVNEEEFLNKIFNGYVSMMQDFSFVERKPLLLEFYNNIYLAFKDNVMDGLTDNLDDLSKNKAALDVQKELIDDLDVFNGLMATKAELQDIDELELKREITNLKSRLSNLTNEFQLTMDQNDYDSVSKLMDEAQALNAEINKIANKYADLYKTIKSVKDQN